MNRTERRNAIRAAERRRQAELERTLEEPQLTPFEKPPEGRIVNPTPAKRK